MTREDKSSKIKKALRQGFRDGFSKLADRKCYGYDRAIDGTLVINQEESEIEQWIFKSYRSGHSLGKIAKKLEERGTSSPTGQGKWNREAISKLLCNEKFIGSVLLQKMMSEDGYQVKNQGDLDRVLIRNHHFVIISIELFEAVQNVKVVRSKDVTKSEKIDF
nr:recombinase family protein [uncultured Clostridium sp.]